MPAALDPPPRLIKRKGWRSLRPPGGIAGGAFWLALWFGLVWLLRQVPGVGGALLGWMQVLVGLALVALATPLAWRLVQRHLLWSLRNKLILTYLLIGLAPVVLFVTLVTISSYIAAGQFSIHLADSRMRQELDKLAEENAAQAQRTARVLQASPGSDERAAAETARSTETMQMHDPLRSRLHPQTAVYLNGAPLPTAPGFDAPDATAKNLLGLPAWAADLHGEQFRGLVLDGEDLYLVAIDQQRSDKGGLISVITSLPVDAALLDVVAKDLGRVHLAGVIAGDALPAQGSAPEPVSSSPNSHARSSAARGGSHELHGSSVYGGSEPFAINFCDFRVSFFSTLETRDWETGELAKVPAAIEVHSRPSLLYRQLFGPALGGVYTNYILDALAVLCFVFLSIEALALWMARRLSGSITMSVQELYSATQHVDRGDFRHRIAAAQTVQQDQLGELARSFNRMSGSLERLLIEQHEKERLQSELTIAQEVQANLFPHHVRNLPTLELHGICRPARSVSGDYYDFLIFHHADNADGSQGGESGVGIALGDISGKGISAALLMATLHSAVRAYRLASEDLVYSDTSLAGLFASREERTGDGGKLFESPGRILSMLNRHLYRSTQPEKYATLFLAHYDSATAQLTYSNAGHLPPLVLGRNGKVRRLDCGGTVVGLMDGMRYEQGRIPMQPGDLMVGYSDGVTEPENDFGEFGEARLMEVVARYSNQPLHVISAQVMLALDAWIGAEEQPDDITLVLARQI